jgi:hypothetical protein
MRILLFIKVVTDTGFSSSSVVSLFSLSLEVLRVAHH